MNGLIQTNFVVVKIRTLNIAFLNCITFIGLCFSNLSKNSVTLSWKDVPLIKATDSITYILFGGEKESSELEQVGSAYNMK